MRTPPHHGTHLLERLDLLLTVAAFDLPTTLLFLDDGVFQSKKNQQPEVQELKDTACILNSLQVYGVQRLFVESESLAERGLTLADLHLPAQEISRSEVGEFMHSFETIINS